MLALSAQYRGMTEVGKETGGRHNLLLVCNIREMRYGGTRTSQFVSE